MYWLNPINQDRFISFIITEIMLLFGITAAIVWSLLPIPSTLLVISGLLILAHMCCIKKAHYYGYFIEPITAVLTLLLIYCVFIHPRESMVWLLATPFVIVIGARLALALVLLSFLLLSTVLAALYLDSGVSANQLVTVGLVHAIAGMLAYDLHRKYKLRESRFSLMDKDLRLFNPTQFYYDLRKEVSRANRDGSGLTLLLLKSQLQGRDIHYRKQLVQRLNQLMRPFDMAYHVDTATIAVIMPYATSREADHIISTAKVSECAYQGSIASLNVSDEAEHLLAKAQRQLSAQGHFA